MARSDGRRARRRSEPDLTGGAPDLAASAAAAGAPVDRLVAQPLPMGDRVLDERAPRADPDAPGRQPSG